MKTTDFDFYLPDELISQFPSEKRGEDKLMLLSRATGAVSHYEMKDFCDLVDSGSLLIFNNSRVRKARVYAKKEKTGTVCEFLFLERKPDDSTWSVMTKNTKKQKEGTRYIFPDGTVAIISLPNTENALCTLRFSKPLTEEWFEKNGHIPLPPYIKRADSALDEERYQTIYAKDIGSVACPTAGLHFTEEIFEGLRNRNIDYDWLTLHVGAGTFMPVYEEQIEDHKMHKEVFTISEDTAAKINLAKKEGRPVVAVGTTAVRTLESACGDDGVVKAGTCSTDIFIYPPYRFKIVDQIFTNFHTPKSTLLMLVSAFASREYIINAYKIAVAKRYRFFSYGDAMFIK